ncbi:hypothetical protein WNY58_08520 [Neptuniibacter pectenicola]|jgi:hypothetical protein|uniref:EF-hand domain-containing protein n=1 Tax=Neptuniibacter pectenicola TaxID=1806669 RepID=A0ABU9TRS9_9GAMM|nr:hypothetical protein [Neptuniibacter pectenicola]KXJ51226.1 MAG: hypothetical protein AXW15_11945 [Neptuniibacter sp. Phe_28]|tara:strand:- start:2285 stop:2614 length:330 start_codon:yes stop_codon:yes gene_type:complete
MKITTWALASLLTISSSIVVADTLIATDAQPDVMTNEQPKTPSIFEKLDENKDGKVSPQEAQVSPALVKGFDKIDTNRDGFLSPDEFSQLQVNATPTRTYIVMASLQAL